MASHFSAKYGIVLVNIEFDGIKKKNAAVLLLSVGQRRFPLVNCALAWGLGAGGLWLA